jgi:metallo-beta-lactamase family protein
VEESKALNGAPGPMVIISASGMCEGGRILHHLRHGIGDARNVVLFVGFQAENTLGRRLVDGQKDVRILGEPAHVAARIESISALSAHADRDELLAFIATMGPGIEHAFVVHGEPEGSEALAEALRTHGVLRVTVPAPGEAVTI